MNIPPPAGKTLSFKTEGGDPLIIRFEHGGEKYVVRCVQSVVAVFPTGSLGQDGLPQFSITLAPSMVVSKETK